MHAWLTRLFTVSAIPLGALVGVQGTPHSPHVARQNSYTIQDWYQGSDFFDPNKWYAFVGSDPTNGNVNYVSITDAQNQGLAYIGNGNTAVMGVDSTSYVPPGGNRNSVRITSQNSYSSGLFIIDAVAMPVGCGTWPSVWTNGPNWPVTGEIDIIEGINNQPNNQMTLHSGTSNPCTIDQSASFTGQVLNNQCYSTQDSDSGCSIADSDTTSFGYGFNDAGGGVFAFLWDPSTGISMWHFPRWAVPGDITNQSPTPSNWGEPAGYWSSTTCDISDNFGSQSIIIDTTICGSWAGAAYGNSGCPGTCEDMVANTTNFANAKWEFNYIAVYQ